MRKVLLVAVGVMFVAWVAANFSRITAVEEGLIRFVLGGMFALLILLRPKADSEESRPSVVVPAAGAVGAILSVLGIVFGVHQFEWLGIVTLMYACLRWALPGRYAGDILLSMFIMYWVHPLPGQIFGQMQLSMQQMSIRGGEFLLHCLNVRCWADGLVLHVGPRAFGVPEACSGMRTAVTVLICTLGVCFIYRFRWYETAAFMVLGLGQVLLLNIVRITTLVFWARRMPPAWSETVLHDTLGIFLFIALVLVQLEVSWWRVASKTRRRLKKGQASGELERPDKASRLPRVWRLTLRWAWIAILAAAIGGVLVIGVRRGRPSHRASMIADMIDTLVSTDPATAERAIMAALELSPGNRSVGRKLARLHVSEERFEEGLKEFEKIPEEDLTTLEVILKSWALMGLDREEEAMELVDGLPPGTHRMPGVAIVRAEYASRRDQTDAVAANVAIAAKSHLVINRVRILFPYLAAREQWRAIADCDSHMPHEYFGSALIAVHANLKVREDDDAMRILTAALEKWPDEPRFLSSLFTLASGAPGSEWETLFADTLRRNLGALDEARLATYLTYCMRLHRPDLAWRVYLRLQQVDPRDPALFLAPVEFGRSWFLFRRHQLGLQARNRAETIDLRHLYRLTRGTHALEPLWSQVPLAEALGSGLPSEYVEQYLGKAIQELERRRDAGELTERLEMTYPVALGMSARFEEAHAELDRLAREYPDKRASLLLQHAMFYDRQRDWQHSYETLLEYDEVAAVPTLNSRLMLFNAMMNLNLGLCAMQEMENAREVFPGAVQLDIAEAAIWSAFGFREEALDLLSQEHVPSESKAMAQLLYDTGRTREAQQMARALGITIERHEAGSRELLRAPPAELSVVRLFPPALSDEELDENAEEHTARAEKATSPFIRNLNRLLADWYKLRGKGDVSDPARWKAVGRKDTEQAAALHRLAALAGRMERYDVARAAIDAAVEILPGSPVLRRLQVSLSEGDAEVVAQASEACPADAEVWLASLVTRLREEGAGTWVADELREVVSEHRFPPRTSVRAGQFLLQNGHAEAAMIVARDGVARARGYLPAYVLGVNCGITLRDIQWALDCGLRAAENSDNPALFYRLIVKIKTREDQTDADLIAALEYLMENFSDDTEWAERLGHVYFSKRDVRRALTVLDEAFAANAKKMRAQSLMLAAESARVAGDAPRAVEILDMARSVHPANTNVLNNLVYTLAHAPGGLPRARELLPQLLALDNASFAVLDTVATVWMRSGDLEKASQYMDKALAALVEDTYAAPEVQLNAAELHFRLGQHEKALEEAQAVRRVPDKSDALDLRARQLIRQIEKAMRDGGA